MEASKVILSPEVLNPNNSLLSAGKKKQLRRERVLAFVRSKPAGTPLTIQQIAVAVGYSPKTSSSAGWQFINKMVEDGVLIRDKIPFTRKSYWTIPGDAKVVQPPQNLPNNKSFGPDVSSTHTPFVDPPQSAVSLPSLDQLEALAKDYAWASGDDSLFKELEAYKGKDYGSMTEYRITKIRLDDLRAAIERKIISELENQKERPITRWRGAESEEEIGYQKGISAQINLCNKAIDERIKELQHTTGDAHE